MSKCLGLFLLLTSFANAQFSSGVEGTVTDASQAAVPGAQITLTNEDTQVVQSVVASATGFFRITQLPPGNYRLEVRCEGFKTWVQTGLVLAGSEIRTVYPSLAVGEQVAKVEVTAALNAIDTVTTKVSRSVEETTIAQTPMVGRNVYVALIALAPGVTGSGGTFGSGANFNTDSFQSEPGYQLNAAGQRQETNEYSVDGTSVNGNSRDGIANLTPQPDTVQEMRVSANSFSAEKGRNSGALIEVFTKSGTNALHGTLSFFHTNNHLASRTVFQNSIPASRRNEYGFTVGGPVIKNKTFFFGSFYGLSSSIVSTSVIRAETPEFRNYVQGNYPNSIAARFFTLMPPLLDPQTQINTVAQVRTLNPPSFPSAMFPNDLPAVGTSTITMTTPQPARQWNFRIDQNLRNYKDRVYFSWFRPTTDGDVLNPRPTLTYRYPTYNVFGRLSWTHTFTPTLLNEASMSMVRAGGWYPPAPGEAANLPNASVSGLQGFGQAGYYRWQHHNFVWHDGLTWIKGQHQVRFGADIDRQRGYAIQANNARPSFNFQSILDFAQDMPFSQSGPTIDIAAGDTAVNLYRKLYTYYTGLYLQDDWKVTKRLTLNLGLRWDYFGHWATGHQGIVPFPIFTPDTTGGDINQQQVANGTMQVRGPGYFAYNKPSGFAPRVGFAWDVFGNGSTSIRGGWGVFYSRVANLAYATNGSNTNSPAFGSPSLNIQQAGARFGYALGSSGGYYFAPPPGFSFTIDPRGGIVGTRVGVGGMDPYPDQPTTQNWTFSIQRRLGSNFYVEADYLGSHSEHLYTQTDINRFAGDLVVNNGRLTRLNPSFGSVVYGRTIGESDAHIFSFSVARRFAHGWSTRAIFTTGRALDANSSNDNGVGGGRNIVDAWNVNGQWGRADYDINKRLSMDAVWEVPNPFKSAVLKNVVGGWRLSGTGILQSGLPFSVYTSQAYPNGDFNADGFNWDMPNAPAFGNKLSASRTDFQRGLFTRADFPVPARGQVGNLGRNTFDGPGLVSVNLNIIKATKIPWFTGGDEGATMELRGELFNVLNRVNLNQPSSDMASGLFGRSTSQKQARLAQFGLRIVF